MMTLCAHTKAITATTIVYNGFLHLPTCTILSILFFIFYVIYGKDFKKNF